MFSSPVKQFIFIVLAVIGAASCRKDDILTDSSAKLEFSEDTVIFDTVFTSLGSTTRQLKIYNRNNRPLNISSVRLAGGTASSYRLNLDGIPGKSFSNVEIPGKDSLYLFVEVTVDPNNSLTPYLLQDSVVFETNGNVQDVDLVAFGQNARFIVADKAIQAGNSIINYALLDTSLNATITWDNTLPYVIYGGYAVVDSSQTLIIQPGTKVYFANNSGLWVYRYGTIKVQGTMNDKVVFKGVRLEEYYQDVPGQWDRIWINEGSSDNSIEYAEIYNGFIGLQTECLLDTNPPHKLALRNTIIQNMSGFGMLARYYNIDASNNVIARCGQYGVALSQGGNYDFRFCTIANFWNNGQRNTPTVYLSDYGIDENNDPVHFPLNTANFYNCILWGNNDEELELDFEFSTTSHAFRNVLLKTELNTSSSNFSGMIINQNPAFVDYSEDDYQLQSTSPAKDAADAFYIDSFTGSDIKGVSRVADPDIGAYEQN